MKITPVFIITGIILIGVYISSAEEELIREKRSPPKYLRTIRPSRKQTPPQSRGKRPVTPARKPPVTLDEKQNPPRRLHGNEAWEPKVTAKPGTRWGSKPNRRPARPYRTTVNPSSRLSSTRKQTNPWERPSQTKSTKQPRTPRPKPHQTGWSPLPVAIPKGYGTSAIPGKAGRDYPIYYSVPETRFSCSNKIPGYYANVEARCQAFHVCIERVSMKSFLCPNGTVFNQRLFTCDWWNRVTCADSTRYYNLNEQIGKAPTVHRGRG